MTVVVATVDAERNEIPHPWGASIDGPALILFPALGKEKPRLLPFRDAERERDLDRPSDAPTPADALALLQRSGGRPATRESASRRLRARTSAFWRAGAARFADERARREATPGAFAFWWYGPFSLWVSYLSFR